MQVRRAGRSNQDLDIIADQLFISFALMVKPHGEIHMSIVFLIGGDAQDHAKNIRVIGNGANLLGG